ncbi:putative nuclease HARBI1 [Monomorium pharaonis]|uniref:putative nuclease HARBI1 n=1 Tax=Monomorium pharaonis TaxID=307658 RepID=UPI0017479BEE|nr:putative nuclease HARBI1 [Monomorium pharaonis]
MHFSVFLETAYVYVDGTPQQWVLLYNRLDVEIPSSSTVTAIPLGEGGLVSVREPIGQQAVVEPRTEFLDLIPEWPGSEHNSRIFQNSRIYIRYRQKEFDGMLVGDAGYPALPFLLTPIANPVTDEEISYNMIHGRTRRIVERTFGIWKRRFPCLSRGLQTKLLTSIIIVTTCADLHNLFLIFNDTLEEEDEIENINEDDELPLMPHWQPGDGFLVRNALIERLFNV